MFAGLELVNAVLAGEHAGFALDVVLAEPDVGVCVRVHSSHPLGLVVHRLGAESIIEVGRVDVNPGTASEERVHRIFGLVRVPGEPDLGVVGPDRRKEQVERALTDALGFLDPRPTEPLEALKAVGGVILHPLEDHHAGPATSPNLGAKNLEIIGHTHVSNFCLNETLGAELKATLNLADTHEPQGRIAQHMLDGELCEEMRLARRTAPRRALVPSWLKQRERPSCSRKLKLNRRHRRRAG